MDSEHKYDVFISYSREDAVMVGKIFDKLTECGFDCWMDKNGIESGDVFKSVIVKAIKSSDFFLFFSSKFANNSQWSIKEVNTAVHLKKVIIPVKLDDSPYNDLILFDLGGLDFVNLSVEEKRKEGINMLVSSLKNKLHNKNSNYSKNNKLQEEHIEEAKPFNDEISDRYTSESPLPSTFAEDINISIPNTQTPIIMFAGPQAVGKTTTMLRLLRYLSKNKKFSFEVNKTFRTDNSYIDICRSFPSIIESEVAPAATHFSDTILINIFEKQGFTIFRSKKEVFQIVDTSGAVFSNIIGSQNEMPLFYHNFFNVPNQIIWLLLVEPNPLDVEDKKVYAERVSYILQHRPKTDRFIILINKIDIVDLIERHGKVNDKKLISIVDREYPDLIQLFKEGMLFKRFRCQFLPFHTGSYREDGHFISSNDCFPERLWKMIFKG